MIYGCDGKLPCPMADTRDNITFRAGGCHTFYSETLRKKKVQALNGGADKPRRSSTDNAAIVHWKNVGRTYVMLHALVKLTTWG